MAKVTPVDLCLFAWQGAKSQVGFCWRAWPVAGDGVAKVVDAADIAALAHHGMKSARREPRKLGQRLQHEGQIRIDPSRPSSAQGVHDIHNAGFIQHAPNGGVMHAQLARNGPHAPALGLKQAKDLRT